MILILKSKYINIFLIYFIRREVTFQQGKEAQEQNRFDLFMETSAKDGSNVKNLFCQVGKTLFKETASKYDLSKVSI